MTGRAPYAAEIDDGTEAFGVQVRATIAKGRVTAIGKESALVLPGVLAVIDDERLLRNPAPGTATEALVQGPRDVAYFGQPIAVVVVAETFVQTRHAAQNIAVTYDATTEAVTDPLDGATTIKRSETKQIAQGDIDSAMADAAFSVDATYTAPSQNGAALEPHASIAQWDGDK